MKPGRRSSTGGAANDLAALAATLALIGCSDDNDASGMPMGHNSASSAGAPTATGDFNNADVLFAQIMIPHHEQAVAMIDMLLDKRGVNPEVTALAEQIKAAQQPEIDTMNGWLRVWGRQPMDDGGMHHGSGGGMMTEDEMRQLDQGTSGRSSTGPASSPRWWSARSGTSSASCTTGTTWRSWKRSGLSELTAPSQESQRRMSGTRQGWSCTVVARNANTVSYQTLACCGVRIQWFSSGK